VTIEYTVAAFVILLVLATVSWPLSRATRMPYASMLVMVGFIASELVVFAGYDTGIRADNYQSLVFNVFIPVLVFGAAFNIEKSALRENLPSIIFLAVAGMLLTCFLTAVVLYYGIAHDSGFPWIAALLTGAILAATEPSAVFTSFKKLQAGARLKLLLEGESLFNDATVIVLFGLFMAIALAENESRSTASLLYEFSKVFCGGIVLGGCLGYVAAKMNAWLKTEGVAGMLSVLLAYGAYQLAEMLQVSGVMATLLAGLIFSAMSQRTTEHKASQHFWNTLVQICSAIVFIIVGAVITLEMFEQRWLAMLIAILAVLLARAVAIYGGLGLLSLFLKAPIGFEHQTLMVWAGLRGAVTLALALSLPTTLDYWWTIQSIAFGVVVFTLFIQAPAIRWLLCWRRFERLEK